MEPLFTLPVIIALSIVAIINVGLLLAAYIASKEECYEDQPEKEPTAHLLRVSPPSYIHWSEHPPLEHELRVTPPAKVA